MISKARKWIRKLLHREKRESKSTTTEDVANKESAASSIVSTNIKISVPKAVHENQWTPEAEAAWISRRRAAKYEDRLVHIALLGPVGVGKRSLYRKVRIH